MKKAIDLILTGAFLLSGCGGGGIPELPRPLESIEASHRLMSVGDTTVVSVEALETTVAQQFDREKDNGIVALRLESLETTPSLNGTIPMPGYVIGLLRLSVEDLRSSEFDTLPVLLQLGEGLKLIDESGNGYYPVPSLNVRLKEGAYSLNVLRAGEALSGVIAYVLPANHQYVSAVYEWNGMRIDIPLSAAPSGPFYRRLRSAAAQTAYLEYTFHAMAYTEMFADHIAPSGFEYLVLWTTIRNVSNQRVQMALGDVVRIRQGGRYSRLLSETPWTLAVPSRIELDGGQGIDGTMTFLVRKSDEALTFHYDGVDGRIEVPLLSDIPVNTGIPLVTPASSEFSQIFIYGYGTAAEGNASYYRVDLGVRNLREDAVVSINGPTQFWLEFPGGAIYRPAVENVSDPEAWTETIRIYPNEEERGIVYFIPSQGETASSRQSSVVTFVFMGAGGEVRIPLL